MLSLFPQILFLAPFSALLIRIALSATIFYPGWKHLTRRENNLRAVGVVEIATGILLFVGAWTQAAALIAGAIVLVWLAFPSTRILPRSTMLLALIMSLSLLVTGAGAIAFDLPL